RAAPSWPRATGLSAGAVVAVILAAVGVLASRVDVALLAVPLVAAVGLSGSRRISPVETGSASLELGEPRGEEIGYTLTLLPPTGAEMAVVRYRVLDGEPREIVVCGRGASELVGRVPLLHSGPQELLRVDCRFLGVDAASVGAALDPIVASRVLAPRQDAVRSLPLPWRLQGLTGTHESARAGDGGDFRDVHPFRAGDRMRRIDWKATARRGQSAGDLYVRRTSALADATVLVVLDSRDDVGEQVAEWSRNTAAAKGVSSLDVAREAASSLASAYVHAGDRVGFQDLSSSARMVPHGGGERHLSRVLRAIEVTEPAAFPFRRERAPVVPPGALVFLLSSFLDDAPVRLALTWRGSGHRVVAVDVLPSARFARTDRFERIAHRLVLMEREERMEVLRARGVELLRWPEDGTSLPRHVRLLLLARPARRGRPAR
nr:DUF58 domain-containing protein [Actinomycetota bacterium]